MCTLFFGCADNEDEAKIRICEVENCTNPCMEYKIGYETFYRFYCEEHSCKECGGQKEINDELCSFHLEQQIKLTDLQIEEIRSIVDDYITQIKCNYDYILAINIINDIPKTTTHDIKFRCNVVRTDSDINLATIYLYMTDDGVFKIDKLEYDK